MLFRSGNGKLVEIKRMSFVNDKLYYSKIISIMTTPKTDFLLRK